MKRQKIAIQTMGSVSAKKRLKLVTVTALPEFVRMTGIWNQYIRKSPAAHNSKKRGRSLSLYHETRRYALEISPETNARAGNRTHTFILNLYFLPSLRCKAHAGSFRF